MNGFVLSGIFSDLIPNSKAQMVVHLRLVS